MCFISVTGECGLTNFVQIACIEQLMVQPVTAYSLREEKMLIRWRGAVKIPITAQL